MPETPQHIVELGHELIVVAALGDRTRPLVSPPDLEDELQQCVHLAPLLHTIEQAPALRRAVTVTHDAATLVAEASDSDARGADMLRPTQGKPRRILEHVAVHTPPDVDVLLLLCMVPSFSAAAAASEWEADTPTKRDQAVIYLTRYVQQVKQHGHAKATRRVVDVPF